MYEIVSRNFLAILLFIIAPPTVKGQESLDNIIVLGDQAKQSPSIEVMDVQGSVKDKHFKISVHKNFKVAGVYNNKQFQIRFPHNLSNFNIDMSSISWGVVHSPGEQDTIKLYAYYGKDEIKRCPYSSFNGRSMSFVDISIYSSGEFLVKVYEIDQKCNFKYYQRPRKLP